MDTGSKFKGNQEYYGGYNKPDGFGHGHRNHDTGYDRPPMTGNPDPVTSGIGWTAIMGTIGKSNVNKGN